MPQSVSSDSIESLLVPCGSVGWQWPQLHWIRSLSVREPISRCHAAASRLCCLLLLLWRGN
eukprot:COSAG01_NODE_10975_length_2035_cov_3759.107955_1_plen_60_part_10